LISEAQLKVGTASAYAQALKSFREGGVPVGSALVQGDAVVAVGHNRRFQRGSNILHGEMDCIENAGHLVDFSKTILFTTLSPCLMCAHTVLLFRIPTVIILDDVNTQDFVTSVDKLKAEGIEVIVERHEPSIELNRRFQTEFRNKWLGDVGLE
jgi:creatinine deaminase